jgi:hypothetical protein
MIKHTELERGKNRLHSFELGNVQDDTWAEVFTDFSSQLLVCRYPGDWTTCEADCPSLYGFAVIRQLTALLAIGKHGGHIAGNRKGERDRPLGGPNWFDLGLTEEYRLDMPGRWPRQFM